MKRIPAKWRVVLFSRHFRCSFLTMLSVTAVPALLAGAVLAAQLTGGLERGAREQAGRLSAAVQEIFTAAKTNAVFTGLVKSVEGLLSLPEPALDDYVAMAADLSVFANTAYYESVDIFLNSPRKVYVSKVGLYDYDEYPGADLIALMERDSPPGGKWLVGREYRRYYGVGYPNAVATYLHCLPVYASESSGYVAVHVSLASVEKLVREKSAGSGWEVLVGYGDALLYSSAAGFSVRDGGFFESARDFARENRLLYAPSSDAAAARCVYLIPQAAVRSLLAPYLLPAALVFLLIAAAAAVCSFLYSAGMLRPVRALMLRAGGADEAEIGEGDEFDLLNRAFDRLSGEIAGIRRQMDRNRPLIQERLILELITNFTEIPDADDAPLLEDYAGYGVTFPHRRFAVVISTLPEFDQLRGGPVKEQIKIVVRQKALERFSSLGTVYSAYGENESVLFLINTGVSLGLSGAVRDLCETLARSLSDTLSTPLLFSAGVCRKDERVPYRAYVQARRGLSYTDSAGESAVYLSGRSEYTPSVDLRAVRQLVQCILDRDLPALRGRLDAYFAKYLTADAGADGARKLSCVLLSLVNAHLIEMDAPADEDRLAAALKKIGVARTADECAAILLAHTSSMIGAHRLSEESYAYVRDAAAFMEEHYRERLNIPEIAGQVALNPVYLNRLFKLSTGKTVSEYLNSHRICQSLELLRSGGHTVAAISGLVGYHDVRSYIRFFRKYNGVTPSEYRRRNGAAPE